MWTDSREAALLRRGGPADPLADSHRATLPHRLLCEGAMFLAHLSAILPVTRRPGQRTERENS